MRIALVTDRFPPYRMGGAGEVAHQIYSGLRKLGHEVHVITTGQPSPDEDHDTVHRLSPSLAGFPWATLRTLPGMHRRRPFDLIHSNQTVNMGLLAWHMTLGRHVPLVQTWHASCAPASLRRQIHVYKLSDGTRVRPTVKEWVQRYVRAPIHYVVDRGLGHRAQCNIAVSDGLRVSVAPEYGLDASRFVTVTNSFDPDRFPAAADPAKGRARLGLTDEPVVLNCSVYALRKRHPLLIPVLAELVKHPSLARTRLVLVGDLGRIADKLRAVARAYGVERNLILTGRVTKDQGLADLYAAADLCLFPSVYETFGVAHLEAMAVGRPVVGVKVHGVTEVVEHGVTGYLVDQDDYLGMAAHAAELLLDPAKARRLGQAGMERARRRFPLEGMVRGYLDTYRRVLAARGTAVAGPAPAAAGAETTAP